MRVFRIVIVCLTALIGCDRGLAVDDAPSSAGVTQTSDHEHTNALIDSTSPYLLQHAHNPVNWMPWGPEAFALAKETNKLVFVSIGYSTCYWCHVMERESFENEDVAAVLNEHFIAIKVDREERPDIDSQMMLATQLMTGGGGGWPNSVWLTPDGRPWMAGTYFPRPQFLAALGQISELWDTQADKVDAQATALADAISSAMKSPENMVADDDSDVIPLVHAITDLSSVFDKTHGGIGTKPKFPPHGALRMFAVQAGNDRQSESLTMMTQTLDAMWRGGVHDHVGGGFHRYATDERWLLPHFEKMLYDNAQLMRSYTDAFELTGEAKYARAVEDIYSWLVREMTHQDGGFYSAIDSESNGEEGNFYTWTNEEVQQVVGEQDAAYYAELYGFEPNGNYVEQSTGERTGRNIPHLKEGSGDEDDVVATERILSIAQRLLAVRSERIQPGIDDKVLTSWNGLMISSLARAGRVISDPRYTATAEKAANFLLTSLQDDQGTVLRSWRKGTANQPGYLDDYAFLAEALLDLYETTSDQRWLDQAQQITREMTEQFEDGQAGGFFYTSDRHEDLIVRSKNLVSSGNMPVANGVAIQVLLRLHQATDDEAYLQTAVRGIEAFRGVVSKHPHQVEHLVLADSMYRQMTASEATGNQVPADKARHADQAIIASLILSQSSVAPGGELELAVVIEISPRFHLYSVQEDDADFAVISAQVVASDPEAAKLRGVTIDQGSDPVGQPHLDDILGIELNVIQGTAIYRRVIAIDENASIGTVPIRVELTYQACDDRQCLQPQTVTLETTLEISADLEPQQLHSDVFSISLP